MDKYHTRFIANSSIIEKSISGKKHIVVVAGGMSAEREVSLMSSESVVNSLLKQNYKVTVVDMGADIANVLSILKPDIVFNCLHGTYGEDGCLPGLLNIMHIPYTHSGVLASSLGFDKLKLKEIFTAHNIRIPKTIVVNKADDYQNDPVLRPYVIKPISQGSSVGVEVIFNEDNFNFADYKFPYGNKIIVEEYIKGRELQVAVLNGKAYGVLEIQMLKARFYDYEAKYTKGLTKHIMQAKIPREVYDEVLKISEKVFSIFGCKGLVRTEFIYDDVSNKIFMLELNTHPGFTALSICSEILEYHGIDFDKIIHELIDTATFE